MFCGKLKRCETKLKVKDLIDILKPYKDLDIKVAGKDTIYIHFDQSADYVELSNVDYPRLYGIDGKFCKGTCKLFDEEKGCMCTGENCVGYELYKAMDEATKTQAVAENVEEDVSSEEEDNIEEIKFVGNTAFSNDTVKEINEYANKTDIIYKMLLGSGVFAIISFPILIGILIFNIFRNKK